MVDMPEWLSGMTRNHVGSARAGSNPAVHAFFLLLSITEKKVVTFRREYKKYYKEWKTKPL